ncbi:MAG: class I SAM-dependent methyltransferase [Planctomycetes bacterium]|nr:class I SAM-dependent methyltransferase [Planctomycetota bacterium]
MRYSSAIRWLAHGLRLRGADTQTTQAERACLARHARGKKSLVEIGVMYGANTALLRSVMDPLGTVTGIDPHPNGRLRVSFERWIALRELARRRRGTAQLLRKPSFEAAGDWGTPIDFLFIDGDHSWAGIDRDWRDWSRHVTLGGVVALHDSRSVPGRQDLDSVRYTQTVVLRDSRFREIDAADSLTVLERTGIDGQ